MVLNKSVISLLSRIVFEIMINVC